MEVDSEQAGDELAGCHPPGEEGEEAAVEEGGEDAAQGAKGLRDTGHRHLDVLLDLLPLLVQARGQNHRGGAHSRGHPRGLGVQTPRVITWREGGRGS